MSGESRILDNLIADGIAKQKLHVIMIVDTSRSMQGKRIAQVNSAIADIHKYLIDLQDENSNVDFYISIMTFANTAEFLAGYKGVNVNAMTPPILKASGYSNLHLSYIELTGVLRKESAGGMMPDFGGIAPIVLLMTDGHPTKAADSQLRELRCLPWFRASLRYGIAIELADERTLRVLSDFTEDDSCVIQCIDANMLAKIIQIVVMTASKVKSQSSAVRASAGGQAKPPLKAQKKKNASPLPPPQGQHAALKQQIKATLDEIDDWEW